MRVAFLFLALPLVMTSGFLFPMPMSIKEGLVQVTDAQKTTPLSIKLDVGVNNKDQTRMNVSGLIMELSSKLANYQHPKMPGADGPQPQLSSGVRSIGIIQEGSFISMSGQQIVETLNGCWEMIWRQNAAAGTLICGFDVPDDYHRNDAYLPKGRVYLSFPVWTKIGLKEAQDEKNYVDSRTKELDHEKKVELDKMEETGNFLMKALHYRNAAAAMEKMSLHNPKTYEMVPSNDEIIPLQDDLLLTTKGLVFSKEGSFHTGAHVLLGTAIAKPVIT